MLVPGVSGHIVAMGGGGFLMEPDNPLLDHFVLSLAPRQPARLCFLPTARAIVAEQDVIYAFSRGRACPGGELAGVRIGVLAEACLRQGGRAGAADDVSGIRGGRG